MMKAAIMGSAAIGLLAVAGLGAPGLAQEERQVEKVERKAIRHVSKDGKVTTMHHGEAMAHAECPSGEKAESDIAVGGEEVRHRTRIAICAKTSAEARRKLAEALEEARGKLGSHEGLSAEQRAEMRARIEAEIARLRAGS